MLKASKLHQAVLLDESIKYLNIKKNQFYLDATFGRGGHTEAILKQGAKVIAFDCDQEAIDYGQNYFKKFIDQQQLILVKSNFNQLNKYFEIFKKKFKIQGLAGILFDLGTSMDQLKSANRGFSFDINAPLDMRMDQNLTVKASDLLKVLPAKQLNKIFYFYGGEHQAKKIADEIVQLRQQDPRLLDESKNLVQLILKIKIIKAGKIHPATKVFQALRIAVNDELENLKQALTQCPNLIKNQGRLVTIAFHEGEDRIIKQNFRFWQQTKKGQILTKKIIKASPEEIINNPRARSARLRCFEFF